MQPLHLPDSFKRHVPLYPLIALHYGAQLEIISKNAAKSQRLTRGLGRPPGDIWLSLDPDSGTIIPFNAVAPRRYSYQISALPTYPNGLQIVQSAPGNVTPTYGSGSFSGSVTTIGIIPTLPGGIGSGGLDLVIIFGNGVPYILPEGTSNAGASGELTIQSPLPATRTFNNVAYYLTPFPPDEPLVITFFPAEATPPEGATLLTPVVRDPVDPE